MPGPAVSNSRLPTRIRAVSPHALCFLAWVLAFSAIAVAYGPDASWDLRNYHLYGPFALLHGRLEFDLAPAQLQTFLPPTLDIPSYWLRSWLNSRPALLDALLSLPHGIGAYLATLIALRFLPASLPWRWPVAVLLAAIGATGTAGLPTVATSQSEMVPGCLVLAGFLLLLRQIETGTSRRTLLAAGLLFGAAAGLKLTSVPYCLGATVAVLLSWPGSARTKVAAVLFFGLCGLGGLTLVAGWWWLHLWTAYGNPVFPFLNGWFRSPYGVLSSATDERFKPRGVLQALFYPFYWGLSWRHPIAEPLMRDPRFMLAYLGFGATVACRVLRFPSVGGRRVGFLLVFCGISYVAWEALFSILRYLAPLELLCGILIFLPLRALAGSQRGVMVAGLAAAVAGALLLVLTIYPDWGRAQPRSAAVSVDMPRLEPNSLIILLDYSAMGYLAAFVPPSARVVGADNGPIQPGSSTLFQERAEQLIRTYSGPIYGMENPREAPRIADRILAYYGLHRGAGCAQVRSNLDHDGTMVCPLVRNGRGAISP